MGLVPAALVGLLVAVTPAAAQLSTRSVRTLGVASTSADSVRISIDAPVQPADVGAGAFTVEQWLRCTDAANAPLIEDYRGTDTQVPVFDWISGRIFLDRDILGNPPSGGGDWGASIHRPAAGSGTSVVRWGAQTSGGTQLTIQGSVDVCDDTWHHVAVGRNGANQLFIIVDGAADFTSTSTIAGSLAYPNDTGSGQDPLLVWGNEKHAIQAGYRGYLDELRVWSVARTAPEVDAARFTELAGTTPGLELYLPLEEGSGQALADRTGKNDGALFYAGEWATSVPSGGGGTTSTSTTSTSTSSSSSTLASTSSTSSTAAPASSTSTSTSSSSTLEPGGTTSTSSTAAPAPTTSTSTSTTTSFPPGASTTSSTVPQGCTSPEDCDDDDPCTVDDCVAGACRQVATPGPAGATCELGRFVDAALCPSHPPRAKVERSIRRRLRAAARLVEAAAAAGSERPRGRRKMAAALKKLDGAAATVRRVTEKGRLADQCAAAVLAGLERAETALAPGDPASRAR